MTLSTYTKKRNFKHTPEPLGKGKASSTKLIFVVQRHDASHLHYDFRLQLNGVLKSWAIPKGPSMNPGDKRLAVMVEDHPLSYANFEGDIPKGNYGAGHVDVWDKGLYTPLDDRDKNPQKEIERELKKGSLKFNLFGEKLKGSFALVKLKDGKEKNWLLIKHKDEYAVSDAYDIEDQKGSKQQKVSKASVVPRSVRSGGTKLKTFIKPMLTHVKDEPFDDPNWIFEIKWDGYRAVTEIKDGAVKFYSRNGLSFIDLYPSLVTELKKKIKHDIILDGEIVALDDEGKPSFQKLQNFGNAQSSTLVYYVFDCLAYKGKDLTKLPLLQRKEILKKALPKSDVVKFSDHVAEQGKEFFSKMIDLGGLEGMIAKRADSTYSIGIRSNSWLKIKNHNTQEAVIAGFTAPRASRKYFGALVLGVYERGKLNYIGHTGTGFTEKLLKEIYEALKPLVTSSPPFSEKIPVNEAVTWVKPKLVCAVKFSEQTEGGILRHPVFMGLRIDKSPKEVDHIDPVVTAKSRGKKKIVKKTKSISKPANDKKKTTRIDGHDLHLTNQDKLYWPKEGITKGDVINYYNGIYKYIIPYLKDRPQSLKRNPNGIDDKGFYHKDAGDGAPEWVKSIPIYSESANKDIDYIICNDHATLTYLNNLGCIEINPWNSRVKKMDYPDYLIIDIDPSEKNTFDEVVDTALATKEVLDKAGATSYCKTSGATGLHIYVPLHAAYTYDQARSFAEIIASLTQEKLPAITTLERSLSKRKNRIYIDYLQNKRGQTLAAVYSLRPVPGASVSTPLLWKEVKRGLHPSDFTLHTTLKRIEKKGDLFNGVLKEKTNIEKCLKKLEV